MQGLLARLSATPGAGAVRWAGRALSTDEPPRWSDV
jgi:hypothetical protein